MKDPARGKLLRSTKVDTLLSWLWTSQRNIAGRLKKEDEYTLLTNNG